MRTSRISRDTARIVSATTTRRASQRLRNTRSSVTKAPLNATEASSVTAASGDAKAVADDESNIFSSDSDLSSVPKDLDWEDTKATVSRKRKRSPGIPVATSIKHEAEEISIAAIESPNKAASKPKKARRTPAKRIVANGVVKFEPPPNWEEIYALTREMRNENPAPVDTMGCESLADRTRSPRDQRFQTLVSLMLSSQTKDTVTSAAIKGMQANMPGVSTYPQLQEHIALILTFTGIQPRISARTGTFCSECLYKQSWVSQPQNEVYQSGS